MDTGSIFLILGLFILVIIFISRPFFERRTKAVSAQEHNASALLAERDGAIAALQELDFDYVLGKIPEEDYPGQRARLLQRGADVLRRLDAMTPTLPSGNGAREPAEARLEADIAARREAMAFPSSSESAAQGADDDLETLIASRRRARQEKAAGFCPKCGRPVQKSDRFCPKCGGRLKVEG